MLHGRAEQEVTGKPGLFSHSAGGVAMDRHVVHAPAADQFGVARIERAPEFCADLLGRECRAEHAELIDLPPNRTLRA